MNTFETVTDVLEGHFSSTHSTVSGIKKQKKNRLGTSDSTLNLHYLFLRGESGGAFILQI